MRSKWILITAVALAPAWALAQEPAREPAPLRDRTGDQTLTREQLRQRLQQAAEAQVEAPRTPPTLPDQASEHARFAHQNLAFGKKGEEMRAAAAEASARGQRDAEHAGRAQERRHRGMDNADAMRGNRDHSRAMDHARNEESRGHGGMGGMPGPGSGSGSGSGSGGMGNGGMGGLSGGGSAGPGR